MWPRPHLFLYLIIFVHLYMSNHFIHVGIKTFGAPRLTQEEKITVLENMLIGDGFHWQKSISVKLPGELKVLERETPSFHNRISLINIIPLETYLECVVGSEMNPESPLEFLKAHAVISRSWALGKISGLHNSGNKGWINRPDKIVGWDDTGAHEGFHVCSDDHCQRYQGLQPVAPVALKAIRETANLVLLSPENEIVDARFSKCCGGRLEEFSTCWQDTEVSCLESVADPWCDLSNLSPISRKAFLSSVLKDYDRDTQGYGFRWEEKVRKSDIEKNLKLKFGKDIGKIKSLEPLHRGVTGRIDLLRVIGENSYIDIGKELWIRRLLSETHLYSSAFDIEDAGEEIYLKGRGWGHGVGMCQIGAARMAMEGYSFEDILSFYYPGSRVVSM